MLSVVKESWGAVTFAFRVEAARGDLRLVVQELDLDLGVRHGLAVREHHGAEHAADPVRVRLVERHDLDGQPERLRPRRPAIRRR